MELIRNLYLIYQPENFVNEMNFLGIMTYFKLNHCWNVDDIANVLKLALRFFVVEPDAKRMHPIGPDMWKYISEYVCAKKNYDKAFYNLKKTEGEI